MIKDKLDNAETYYGVSENLKKGFEWLKTQDLDNLPSQKYYIDGDYMYANLQEYATKEDALYEAHRKYIDIQYMIKGEELVGVCDREICKDEVRYEEASDIEFMSCDSDNNWQTLRSGEFLVLFPNDAHKPSITPKEHFDMKNIVKKIVVKVPID